MNILAERLFLLLTVLGCVVLLIGFVYEVIFICIPYQDALPQLLHQQDAQVAIARRFYLAGLIIFLSGYWEYVLKQLSG